MRESYGYLGKPQPFTTKDEVTQWVGDKRNSGKDDERDSMYQEFIIARMHLTEGHVVGVSETSGVLERALNGPAIPDYQDPNNEIAADKSVYHDLLEAQRDQGSAKYKTSAFFRAQVAAKIARSTDPQHDIHTEYASYVAQPAVDERDNPANYRDLSKEEE